MQEPICTYLFVHACTLVNALVLQGKYHQRMLQWVMTSMSASGVINLRRLMEEKTPPAQVAQCQDHLEHKYRSGMQQLNAGNTRTRCALGWCPCASCIWLLHLTPILVPKMVDRCGCILYSTACIQCIASVLPQRDDQGTCVQDTATQVP